MIALCAVVLLVVSVFVWHAEILALFVGACAVVTGIPVVTFMRHHPWQSLGIFTAYLLIGAAWSIWKWHQSERDRATKARADFANKGSLDKRDWAAFTRDRRRDAESYRFDITQWIAFWPFSASWSLIHDPVERIYEELKRVYRRVSDAAWSAAGRG